MKKIVYCDDDFLQEFKVNFDGYIDLYVNKDKDSLNKIFHDKKNIITSDIDFNYRPLLKGNENSEGENIKIVFDSLKEISVTMAIQEKFWVAMYNFYYLDDIFNYVDEYNHYKQFKNKLKSSIIFTQGKKRSLIVQNLARMWWLGYYLYDSENLDNPYWLLDFYTKDKDIIGRSTMFFSSNITNNKNLRLGIIEGIKELTEKGLIGYDRYHYVDTSKYFNMLGSVQVLDLMSREEVKNETINYITNHMIN